MNELQEFYGDVIDCYSRAQALEDGVLVDVSKMAKEAGFKYPVAVTARLWNEYITPDERSVQYGQSIEGRLWDTLWMLRATANKGGQVVFFKLYYIMKIRQRRLVNLKAICGPGDNGEPVITIMLPQED